MDYLDLTARRQQEIPSHVYIDLGPQLPDRYNKDYIFALVRDTECIFAYWEIATNIPREAQITIKVNNLSQNTTYSIQVKEQIGNYYISVSPDTTYQICLGYLHGTNFSLVAVSNIVKTPKKIPASPEYPLTPEKLALAEQIKTIVPYLLRKYE